MSDQAKPLIAEEPRTSPSIHITPKAWEKARALLEKEGATEGGLRLGVMGGGCSGYTYKIRVERQPRPNDYIFEFDGLKIYIDPKSMVYLDGMTLDYQESLMYSGFRFDNPNARRTCSCGTSFTV